MQVTTLFNNEAAQSHTNTVSHNCTLSTCLVQPSWRWPFSSLSRRHLVWDSHLLAILSFLFKDKNHVRAALPISWLQNSHLGFFFFPFHRDHMYTGTHTQTLLIYVYSNYIGICDVGGLSDLWGAMTVLSTCMFAHTIQSDWYNLSNST